ncbi:MAG: L-threonylcarbamoyladenylate synthase [Patescibacteria group bacterium]
MIFLRVKREFKKLEIIKPKTKYFWTKVISALKNQGVLVFPTDTAYGLAADFKSAAALKKIHLIKNRPKNKKIALVASSLPQVKKFFRLNAKELFLARKYWPGPLTLILPLKNKKIKLGVRVPKQNLARQICARFGKPITATSANLAGGKECYNIKDVLRNFSRRKYQPDLIIDAGRLKKVKPSTLVILKNNKIKIIRQGPIKL